MTDLPVSAAVECLTAQRPIDRLVKTLRVRIALPASREVPITSPSLPFRIPAARGGVPDGDAPDFGLSGCAEGNPTLMGDDHQCHELPVAPWLAAHS